MSNKSARTLSFSWKDFKEGRLDFGELIDRKVIDGVDVEFLSHRLKIAARDRDWEGAQALVILAQRYPSPRYAEGLLALLEPLSEHMTNEDVVDALWAIADDDCVPALRRAAIADLDWDEFHALNQKAVLVLKKVNTPAAWAALKDISKRGPDDVREMAQDALG